MIFDHDLLDLAELVLSRNRAAGRRIATAESCTGGLVSAVLTAIAGSSDVVDRGFVTYSNAAKTEMLGVPEAVLAASGAVSEATAGAMASGALTHSHADLAVSVTGIAGPGGGSADKPVGTVVFGRALRGDTVHVETHRFGDKLSRDEIRCQALVVALRLLLP